MNRADALNEDIVLEAYQYNDVNGCPTSEIEELINKIYDDFESRICENCEYYQEIKYFDLKYIEGRDDTPWKYRMQCVKLYEDYGKDFGCTTFKRKG